MIAHINEYLAKKEVALRDTRMLRTPLGRLEINLDKGYIYCGFELFDGRFEIAFGLV